METIDYAAVDFSMLGDSFRVISQHMKSGFPLFEDFLEKGQRLHRSLDHMLLHLGSFFDSYSKIAEHAVHAKGSTREVGTAMTNLSMWHKGLEMRLRDIASTLQHKLFAPLMASLDDWKRMEYSMERENDKELSRTIKEAKEANKGTVKMEKKLAKKDKPGPKKESLRQQLTQQQVDKDNKYATAIAIAKKHLSRVLVEERSSYCAFLGMMNSVITVELGLSKDIQHLSSLQKDLNMVSRNPHRLLEKSLQLVEDVGTNRALSPDTTTITTTTAASTPDRLTPSQSPPPPPPPPLSFEVSSSPTPSAQSPTPSQVSGISLSPSMHTAEVVPVDSVGMMGTVENGFTELRRVITTSPQRSQSPPDIVHFLSQPNLVQSQPTTPTIVRRHAAASNMSSVGVIASPHMGRRMAPPVSQKPTKLAQRKRAETMAYLQDDSSLVQSLDLTRPSSVSGVFDPIFDEDSPLLKAIKEKRLKRAITHDRSLPLVQGDIQEES